LVTDLVCRILADTDDPDVPRLEAEINRLVYQLYDLTPEEITCIESSQKPQR